MSNLRVSKNSLLQSVPDIITKCGSYFITRWDRRLLQNASDFLLQNATVIASCDSTNVIKSSEMTLNSKNRTGKIKN